MKNPFPGGMIVTSLMRGVPLGFEVLGLFVAVVAGFRFMAPGPGVFLDYVLLSFGAALFGVGWYLGNRRMA